MKLLITFLFAVTLCNLSYAQQPASLQRKLTLTWVDNANNEDGFKIQRKIGVEPYQPLVTLQGANILTFSDLTPTIDLSADKTYCYQVAAYNNVGDSAFSNEACWTFPKPKPDGIPSQLTIKCEDCTITVQGTLQLQR